MWDVLLTNRYGVSVLQDGKLLEGWLHNNVSVLNAAELYTQKMVKMINFVTCILSQLKLK